MKLKFEISGKALLAMTLLSAGFVTAEYTSDLNTRTIAEQEQSTPVGAIAMWTQSTAPEGWLELNGQSTAGYPDLAAIVGANVPDFRGEHVRGWDNGAGIDSGRALLSSQADEVKAHSHDLAMGSYSLVMAKQSVNSGGSNAVYSHYRYGLGSTYSYPHESDTVKALPQYLGTAMSSENRVRNIAVMFIIKAEK
jgi:phage-related tail fiber protein